MLHIRFTFIGIKTGWAPKLSAGPLEKIFWEPSWPLEKKCWALSLVCCWKSSDANNQW